MLPRFFSFRMKLVYMAALHQVFFLAQTLVSEPWLPFAYTDVFHFPVIGF
jgi:hypothetical protein